MLRGEAVRAEAARPTGDSLRDSPRREKVPRWSFEARNGDLHLYEFVADLVDTRTGILFDAVNASTEHRVTTVNTSTEPALE